MADSLEKVWAGIDIGKTHHWVCVIDSDGKVLLSAKVVNREADLAVIIAAVKGLAARVVWAVDIIGAPSALILALLTQAQQPIRYASGRVVATMSTAFAGEGKTDAKDAYVIAETARIRRDLMNSVFPTLETEFDYSSCKGALVLLTGYSSPQQLRRTGEKRLSAWLHRRHVRGYAAVAAKAIAAAAAQQITLPGQDIAAEVIAEIAADILALDQRVKTLDTQIADMFASHEQGPIIESMPGFGPILGATLLVAAGDLRAFPTAGHLAAAAGLVPVPNDSGRRSGNLHKPRRYSRRLRHVFYLSAQTAMMREGANRDYYLKKRARGRTHVQAVISLARRRIDVLWALLRDGRTYSITPPNMTRAA